TIFLLNRRFGSQGLLRRLCSRYERPNKRRNNRIQPVAACDNAGMAKAMLRNKCNQVHIAEGARAKKKGSRNLHRLVAKAPQQAGRRRSRIAKNGSSKTARLGGNGVEEANREIV